MTTLLVVDEITDRHPVQTVLYPNIPCSGWCIRTDEGYYFMGPDPFMDPNDVPDHISEPTWYPKPTCHGLWANKGEVSPDGVGEWCFLRPMTKEEEVEYLEESDPR